jgi:hypothetical protein
VFSCPSSTCRPQAARMVRSPFSRWSAPLKRSVPPEFLVRSAHIHGDSVRNRLGGTRNCLKNELLSLHLRNIGFLGISLNFGPKISHTILGIIESLDGSRFHFLLLTPHFELLVENRPKIPVSQVAQNHLLTLHTECVRAMTHSTFVFPTCSKCP